MVQFIDTHCHIQSAGNPLGERMTREVWAKDPTLSGRLLAGRAAEEGVRPLICVGCDLADSRLAIDFAGKTDGCYASIGLHPHEAKDYARDLEKRAEFAAFADLPRVVAVGECGLDYFYTHSPREDQLLVLRFQIELALKHNLPMIFHVREAFADFWPIFDEYQGIRGVLHSYTDNQANLEAALTRGLFIGVNGIATFAKDPAQREVYRSIPLSNLLLETDAPFLTPTPYRGSINEPKHIRTIADFLAKLRGESLQELADVTTNNAIKLFNLHSHV